MRIVIDRVAKTYVDHRGHAVDALRDVSFSVSSRELVALLGPSGCGKSTLLNAVAWLLPVSSGEVTFESPPPGRPLTAMVFQEFALFPWRTVQGNVEFGLEELGMAAAERAGFEARYPHQLSGGMRQRVTRQLMQDELLALWEQARTTILYVTHNIQEAVYMADRVVVLSRPAGPSAGRDRRAAEAAAHRGDAGRDRIPRGGRADLVAHQGPGEGGSDRMNRVRVTDRTRFLGRPPHRALRVLALIGLVVLWEALARAGAVPVLFLPSPVGVLREGWDMLVHLGASLQRLAWGFVIGSVLGIAIGVAVGFFAVAEAIGTPLIAATFPIPKIALLPLLILWLGLGEPSKIAVIALGVFFPMAINTYAGVRQAEPLLIRAAVSFGAGRLSVIRKVVLPSALPMIVAGLRLAAGTARLLLVAAEMIAVESGVGFLVLHADNIMATTKLRSASSCSRSWGCYRTGAWAASSGP